MVRALDCTDREVVILEFSPPKNFGHDYFYNPDGSLAWVDYNDPTNHTHTNLSWVHDILIIRAQRSDVNFIARMNADEISKFRDAPISQSFSSFLSFLNAGSSTYSDFFVSGGQYRGVSGNYYSYSNRMGWNQYTGTRQYMENSLSKAKWATRVSRGIGFVNYGLIAQQRMTGEINDVQAGIEAASATIGTFAPAIISVPWTIGYEGLGRHGISRSRWYQNRFKPWVRRIRTNRQ